MLSPQIDLEILWRGLNIVLAISALAYLLADLAGVYKTLSKRRLYLTFALGGLLLAVVIRSLENIAARTHVGYGTPIVTASCIWCIIGLWISKDDPPEDM